jgi:hypothetical protein
MLGSGRRAWARFSLSNVSDSWETWTAWGLASLSLWRRKIGRKTSCSLVGSIPKGFSNTHVKLPVTFPAGLGARISLHTIRYFLHQTASFIFVSKPIAALEKLICGTFLRKLSSSILISQTSAFSSPGQAHLKTYSTCVKSLSILDNPC